MNIKNNMKYLTLFLQKTVFAFFLALFLTALGSPSFAEASEERITSYDVTAEFQEDGSMRVQEKITFNVTGESIKRGIVRNLPLSWERADGKLFRVGYLVESVTRDGKDEPYTEKRVKDFLDVRIGSPHQFIAKGRHTYIITYKVKNHFSRFPKWDELYWNVTGNGWSFPIDKASFSLSFSPRLAPDGVEFKTIDAYTGSYGERGKNAKILADNSVVTTRWLSRHQGLTVAYTWPLSVMSDIEAPTEEESEGAAPKISF